MKKTITFFGALIFALIIISGCGGGKSESIKTTSDSTITKPSNETIEGLAQEVLKTLQNNDYNAFSKLYLTNDDWKEVFSKSELQANEKKEAIEEDKSELFKSIISLGKQGFDETIKRGIDAGIIWKETSILRTDYTLIKNMGIEKARIIITIKYSSVNYIIIISEAWKSENTWKILLGVNWCDELNLHSFLQDSIAEFE